MSITLYDFTRTSEVVPSPLAGAPVTPEPAFAGVRVVAFDLDCTLVDILRIKRRACEAAAWALADAGLDLDPLTTPDEMMKAALQLGIDRDDLVDAYLSRLLGHPDPRFVTIGRAAFERAEDQYAVAYPRAQRTLVTLGRRGYQLALLSDAPAHRVHRRLHAAHLSAFFEPVITGDETPHGKADTAPYKLLSEQVDASPSEILMVGDNPRRDIGSARRFGCRTVLAKYGLQACFESGEPEDQPDATVDWLDELLELLP